MISFAKLEQKISNNGIIKGEAADYALYLRTS